MRTGSPEGTDLLKHLMKHTLDNIYFKDVDGRFILISHSMSNYFGLKDPDDAIGKTDFDFFSEEHAQQAMDDEQHILKTGEVVAGKVEKETWPDGRVTWVSTSKELLKNADGEVIGTFGISRDITKRKEAEDRAAQYAEELKEANDRMLADLALAAEMQTALLPTGYPGFPSASSPGDSSIRFAHVYHPSETVGGDFFSVVPLSDSRAAILICDVMGHGVRSALMVAMLSSLFHERELLMDDPAACLAGVDAELQSLLGDLSGSMFATAFCMTLDARTGEVCYANAGHPSPFIFRRSSGQVAPLFSEDGESGPALGLLENPSFINQQGLLAPGDRVVLYTDGIEEVTNKDDEEFGVDRLMQEIQAQATLPLRPMLDAVSEAARRFAHDGVFCDDVCQVGVEWVGP